MRKSRIILTAVVTGLILSIPLVAMQLSDEWNWDVFDFVFIGGLLFGAGVAYEFVASKADSAAYRAAAGVTCLGIIVLMWINGAVGIIGDGPVNMMYLAIPAIIFLGSILTQLKPHGMSLVLFAAAAVQMLIPTIALIAFHPAFDPGVAEVFVLNCGFAALFLTSALLFRQASISNTTVAL